MLTRCGCACSQPPFETMASPSTTAGDIAITEKDMLSFSNAFKDLNVQVTGRPSKDAPLPPLPTGQSQRSTDFGEGEGTVLLARTVRLVQPLFEATVHLLAAPSDFPLLNFS